jgi:hypothetical protein
VVSRTSYRTTGSMSGTGALPGSSERVVVMRLS